jgi:hypothetical protein
VFRGLQGMTARVCVAGRDCPGHRPKASRRKEQRAIAIIPAGREGGTTRDVYRMASCCADLGDMGRRPGQHSRHGDGRGSPFLLFWRASSGRSTTP